jgi:hypothetical protein
VKCKRPLKMSQCVLPPMLIDLLISEYMNKNKLTRPQNYALISVGCNVPDNNGSCIKFYCLIQNKNQLTYHSMPVRQYHTEWIKRVVRLQKTDRSQTIFALHSAICSRMDKINWGDWALVKNWEQLIQSYGEKNQRFNGTTKAPNQQ